MTKGNGSAHTKGRFRQEPSSRTRNAPALAQRSFAVLILLLGLIVAGASAASAQDQASPQASASVAPPPVSQQNASPAPAPAEPVHHSASARSSYDDHLSTGLNDFLHSHHLPFVDAMVFSNTSGDPVLVKLSGQVRTEHGKEDAASKSSDFLNQPRIKVQNRIKVDSGLASTAPASTSASAEPAPNSESASSAPPSGTSAPNDPCSDLCLKDEGHCSTACKSQAAGGATGGGLSVPGLLGQFGQSATQMQQCNDQCVQTREHCVYDCRQNSSAGAPREAADSGASPRVAPDQHGEGPDTPPE